MPDESDAAGTGGFNSPQSLGAGFDLRLTELEGAANTVSALNASLKELQGTLRGFGSMSGNALNTVLKDIKSNAAGAAAAVGSLAGSGGRGSGTGTGAFGGNASWAAQATQQAGAGTAQQSVGQRLTGGIAAASSYLTGFDNPLAAAGMGTLRFLRDRIGTNRNTAIQAGAEWSMVARQQGSSIAGMMGQAANFPGGIYGSPSDLLGLFGAAPSLGASYGFGGQAGAQGPRAAGMFAGIREAQMLNPGATVGQITSDIASFSANTGAQQQSQMLTGGAFSMIAAGGRQKTISEWAEAILKWLQGLRGGSNRDTPFTYGELMAQYFPGSNIDAWFQANGVPQNMRNYWWTYALEKASKGNPSGYTITPDDTNVAYQRLRASSELTRTEFSLGSQMTGAYLNKEQANKWFNQMFGQAQTSIIPALAGGIGSWIQYLPDTVEDVLMSGVEGVAQAKWGAGDIGDSGGGGYGATGGTGLAGLSPNMRSKLGPMLKANPRLKVNSGLRDNAMQKRLKKKGYSRVSGKPSSHTRGDAADLGPSSEYGWIMNNAKKFGLKSGKDQGEPWHVGVGDVGDVWDLLGSAGENGLDIFQNLLGGADSAGGFADLIGGLLGKLLGGLTGLTAGAAAPAYDPGFYDKLVSASMGMKIGGLPSNTPSKALGSNIWGPSGSSNMDTSRVDSTYGTFFQQVLQGLGVPVTQANLTKLGAIAKYEGGGGTFNPFNSTGGDFPNKFNSVGVENYPDWATGVDYTTRLLSQSNTSQMRANLQNEGSYADWKNATSAFYASWGGPPVPNISESSANAFLGQTTRGAIGDVEEMRYQQMMAPSPSQSRGGVNFNNTFMISGGGGVGAGGIDMRRTVTLMANHLEDEMNKRLARVN